MLSIKNQMTILSVTLADFLDHHPPLAQWRASNNRQPAFTDAEVLTLALMQSYFRTATLKRTFLLVLANDPQAFPKCPTDKQWLAPWPQLTAALQTWLQELAQEYADQQGFYLLDAQPMPRCHPLRHGRVLLLRDEGAGFGNSTKGWFLGFKLHLLVTAKGLIINAILTPGNWHDRDVATALVQAVDSGSVGLGDRGYRRPLLHEEWFTEDGILLLTRADAGASQQGLLCSVRERVETGFSQLWSRLATRVYARSWRGLWNSLLLKMVDHRLCYIGLLQA